MNSTETDSSWLSNLREVVRTLVTFLVTVAFLATVASPVYWSAVSFLQKYPAAYGHFAGAAVIALIAVACLFQDRKMTVGPGSYILPSLACILGVVALFDALAGLGRLFL